MNPTELAISGPLLVAAVVAVAAGAVSFASPCCLPLVPGYLAYLGGLVGAQPLSEQGGGGVRTASRWRVAGAALLFVLGFTAVFKAAMLAVLGLADALLLNERLLQRLGGVITILMGLVFIGLVSPLQRSVKVHAAPRDGLWGAPLLGAVYGLGWTPCLGPTLTGVIAVATATDVGPATVRGALLITAYCLGLGVPFILLALGASWAVRTAGWLRRHTHRMQQLGGALLLIVGALLVTGLWAQLIALLRGPIGGFTTPL